MDFDAWLAEFMTAESLPRDFARTVRTVVPSLAERIVQAAHGRPGFTVGVCGTQASGKSTLCAVTRAWLQAQGLKVALFSLDDLYLTRAERQALAREIHPLLATRGVPGTHDVALGAAVIDGLRQPGPTAIPAFDKASDDRRPRSEWPRFDGPADIVLFEGWCVGARPQAPAALTEPVNALERLEDPDGVWRAYANAALAGPYQDLFARLDLLVLLQAPGFETVLQWRREQEAKLRARLTREGGDAGRVMDDAAVERFIAHYERLTRHILAEMPARADVVIGLDAQRRPIG